MYTISSKSTLHDLIAAHPELKALLYAVGFTDIVKPGMLTTVGRFMTLEKGMKLKGISREALSLALHVHGFILN